MNTYKIIADTSCDIPVSVFAEKNVTYVPFNVSFDQENYLEELKSLPMNFTIRSMQKSCSPKHPCPLYRLIWMPWKQH